MPVVGFGLVDPPRAYAALGDSERRSCECVEVCEWCPCDEEEGGRGTEGAGSAANGRRGTAGQEWGGS